MKNLKIKLNFVFYTLLVAVFLTSCMRERTTVENLCGGIVYEKLSNIIGDRVFIVRNDDKFTKVYVYELEWIKYEVSDTINCN